MLIEFSVTNFRSFREKQTLSMVAAPRLRKRENVFKPELKGEKFPDLLKVAVIYGPNASGKSNFLLALGVIQQIAKREPSAREVLLPTKPFQFDALLLDQPSVFEIDFIENGLRYYFCLRVTQQRITEEYLSFFPNGKEALLYQRNYHADGDAYTFGVQLSSEFGEGVLEAWKKLTPPRSLFIAQAIANSSEAFNVLRAPFIWLTDSSYPVLNGMRNLSAGVRNIAMDDSQADEVAMFLNEVDIPIVKIKVESSEVNIVDKSERLEESSTDFRSAKTKTVLTHKTALGHAELAYNDQSDGTKNLIGFWLPWKLKNIDDGLHRILLVDELDSSLHPKIVATLVDKHIHSDITSQLIFTTHDTHLMDAKLLRRDQFWITERDINGATQLRSIHDFEGRESEDIEKRYYEGRYRGLPLVKRG